MKNKSNDSWLTVDEAELVFNKDNLIKLFENKLPALRISNFLSHDECERVSSAVNSTEFEYYANVVPKIGRIGITQYEHYSKDKHLYFNKVKEATAKRDAVFNKSQVNAFERVLKLLRENYSDGKVSIAEDEKFGTYFAGLIRFIREANLHFDYAKFDAPEWSIKCVENQLAFNIYPRMSDNGGQLLIYNRPWSEKKFEEHLLPNHSGSYGYKMAAVKDAESFIMCPKPGDLWFFNARNFHRILYGDGTRFSISSFVGRTNDKSIVVWS